jgi:nucleoside-diphosphate-sugar epimerase
MLRDQKILVTGPAGQIAFPMAEYLASDNEVWGIARFSEPGSRERVEAVGVTTRVVDLASGDFGDLPDDFTHVLHLATFQMGGLDYDHAISVNAEGTGLLATHCRKAKAMLVTSTFSLYKPNPDPLHLFAETDPLGDANQPHSPTYSISKIGQEAVARTVARTLGLPVTIARVNASYGPNGGLPAYHLDWMLAGQPLALRAPGPTPYSPICQDDMNEQIEPLLSVASVPATIVNWAGDDVVTAEEWCAYLAEISGAQPAYTYSEYPGSIRGSASDNTRRIALVGRCRVGWREGMRRMYEARYPEGRASGVLPRGADRLLSAVRRDDPS